MMTREEAEAIYDAGKETVVHVLLIMDARIHALEERVQTLENQLAKNSRNSGKPPSSDGFKKPAPKSLRRKGTRKSGGQPGHTGHTLKMADSPDHTEVHRVTESKTYACGCLNKAAFPEGVNAPVQYGEGIKAAAVYLKNYQYLPYERTCELLDDFFGCSMSEGTLANIIAQSHELAADPVEKIKELVERATVAHFDETGSRVEGKLWWLHSASTAHATYYDIHRKRGGEAFDDIGILPDFTGRAIHDFWKPYFGYDCLHGLCNAHHLRELIFVHERHQQHWADRMIDCLLDIKDAVDLARQTTVRLDRRQIQNFEARYQQILDEGYAQNPLSAQPPGKKKIRGRRKKTKARNLRMMKVQQKISGMFRNEDGAKAFCRIRSYISTARKNAVGAMDALTRLFSGNPFVPAFDTSQPHHRQAVLADPARTRAPTIPAGPVPICYNPDDQPKSCQKSAHTAYR